jgi:hypothetical protein
MTLTLSSPSGTARRSRARPVRTPSHGARPAGRRARDACVSGGALASYTSPDGTRREVVANAGADGSVLVIDRDAATLADRRLVAHLADDEPAGNARLVCADYLKLAPLGRGRCRELTSEDLQQAPPADEPGLPPDADGCGWDAQLIDAAGARYGLELVRKGRSVAQLRWYRRPSNGGSRAVCLREVVAGLESYEPVCAITRAGLARFGVDPSASITVLRAELRRVLDSPIVLNATLRRIALDTMRRQGLSMSEVAKRCGRMKIDAKGYRSGETSWLARRLGILPEAGRSTPTPWIHSDVLALIARSGLGLSPREVEA